MVWALYGRMKTAGWALYVHVDNFLFARYSDAISPARGVPLTAEIMWFITADTARRGRTKIFVDVTTVFLTTGRRVALPRAKYFVDFVVWTAFTQWDRIETSGSVAAARVAGK